MHILRVVPDFTQHRYALSETVCKHFGYQVQLGPFAGLKIDPESSWSAADRGSMVLGLYEAPVLDCLTQLCNRGRPLIDVGAADGYYAIGALVGGVSPYCACFEESERGQQVIRMNSAKNGVSDQIEIFGKADGRFLEQLPPRAWREDQPSVFLFDIEGGEFDLLTDEFLSRIHRSYAIVELHEPPGLHVSRTQNLVTRARQHFQVELLEGGPRDPSTIPYLRDWNDDDRWLLMSESRAYAMKWLVLRPKTQ
jgi:hypothetical protein